MKLDLLLPSRRLISEDGVQRIVVETAAGAFGLLPHRRDCVAALLPGVLTYTGADGVERFVAVDRGVLVKTGAAVRVSVRRALPGADLATLRAAVDSEFLAEDDLARGLREVMDKLETGFVSRFAALRRPPA